MSAVLITGAAGFVGAHTARHFLKAGWRVCGYDLRRPNIAVAGMEFVQGDVLNPEDLQRAIKGCGATGIVHQAGIIGEPPCRADPQRAVGVNIRGAGVVLEVARAQDLRVTFLSTATL